MMNSKRICAGLNLFLGSLVLLLCLAGIIGTWMIGGRASKAIRSLLTGVEKSVQAMHSSIEMADSRITDLVNITNSIESSVNTPDQSVKDQVTVSLLPEVEELRMVATAHSIRDLSSNLREMMAGLREIVHAINRFPFLQLDIPGQDTLVRLTEKADQLFQAVSNLRNNLFEFHQGSSESLIEIAASVAEVNELLAGVQTRLAQLDNHLTTLQTQAVRAKQGVPAIFTWLSLIATLFLAWVAYSQLIMILRAWLVLCSEESSPILAQRSATHENDRLENQH